MTAASVSVRKRRTSFLEVQTPERPIPPSALVVPSEFVIHGREHLNVSRVGDEVYDLRCAIGRENLDDPEVLLNLKRIRDPEERRLVGEVIYCALNFDHFEECIYPLREIRPSALTNLMRRLSNLLRDVREDGLSLHEIDQTWLDRWLVRSQSRTPATRLHLIIVWRRLYTYRGRLSFRSIEFAPWGKKSAGKVAGYRQSGETKTPRIPEAIYAPMLRWAIFLIGEGSKDVLAARRHIDAPAGRVYPAWVTSARMKQFIGELRTAGDKIAVHPDGTPAWKHLEARSGVSAYSWRRSAKSIEQLAEKLGTVPVAETGRLTCLPGTNQPWLTGIYGKLGLALVGHILAACYFVVAVLSGMRDSEVTALRRGCLRVLLDEAGRPYRYLVDGLTFKGIPDPAGEPHTWVVIEPVVKAIELVTALQDHLTRVRGHAIGEGKRDLLFLSVMVQGGNPSFSNGESAAYLNKLAVFLNKLANQAADRSPPDEARLIRTLYTIPPDEKGSPWRWGTRQLRKTLAWFIGNEPFGSVAGMIQYGHAKEVMFEGYAGTSASGFPAEIEEERKLAACEDIVEMYELYIDGHQPGGPKGRELGTEFRRIQLELGDLPGQVVDDERRLQMLRNLAVNLYPGYINDCFFYYDHALCRVRKPEGNTPILADCVPEECPNSCISRRHIPAIESCIEEAEEMKSHKRLPPLQLRAIDNQIAIYQRMQRQAAR